MTLGLALLISVLQGPISRQVVTTAMSLFGSILVRSVTRILTFILNECLSGRHMHCYLLINVQSLRMLHENLKSLGTSLTLGHREHSMMSTETESQGGLFSRN